MRQLWPFKLDRLKSLDWRRLGVTLLAAVLIFGLGLGIGAGRISLGTDTIFQKSVSKNLPANLDYATVEQVYDSLKSNFDGQLAVDDLLDGLKQGLARSTGDPYTEYLDPEAAKDFNNELQGTFTGIGAELSKDKNLIVIVSPISGFPAEKAGLKPKDAIIEIDGESAYDLSITEAVSKIRGPKGTKVKIKIIRNGSEELTFEIVRDQITIPSVEAEILDGNIGYLKISRFAEDTAGLARQAANNFTNAKVRGVILDVRGDPGGLLDAAVDLSSLWLTPGKTVLQEKRDGAVIKTYPAKGTAILAGMPTVVLINEGSASASEITAGALKDNGAATLIGVKSFGKGSVQRLINLGDGSMLKVTIARWYTPGGRNIDKEGIEPDQKVERTDEDIKNNRDPQQQAAIDFLKK